MPAVTMLELEQRLRDARMAQSDIREVYPSVQVIPMRISVNGVGMDGFAVKLTVAAEPLNTNGLSLPDEANVWLAVATWLRKYGLLSAV